MRTVDISVTSRFNVIYEKFKNNEELTREELKFLYVDAPIQSGTIHYDPRIEEILFERNLKSDLMYIFNYNEDQIGTDRDDYEDLEDYQTEVLKRGLMVYWGFLVPRAISAKNLKFPKILLGSLDLRRVFSMNGSELPEIVTGLLNLSFLKKAAGLKLPKVVGGLELSSLTSAKGLQLPETVNGGLYLSSLTSAEGLQLPKVINGDLDISGLTSVEGLQLPEIINGRLLVGVSSLEQYSEWINSVKIPQGLTEVVFKVHNNDAKLKRRK